MKLSRTILELGCKKSVRSGYVIVPVLASQNAEVFAY